MKEKTYTEKEVEEMIQVVEQQIDRAVEEADKFSFKWTKKKPIEVGWYWYDDDDSEPVIVNIYDDCGLMVHFEDFNDEYVDDFEDCLWSDKPIPEPESE